MADESLLDKFGSFFSAGNMNDPRVNSQLRQQIALRMMGQGAKKGYPKTIGEGLTAIGDSLGDIGMARQLANADIAQQAQAANAVAPTSQAAPAGAPIMNYAPEDGGDNAAPPATEQAPPAQTSVFETGAPPVQAGAPPGLGMPPAQPPPAETYTPPTPEQADAGRNALAAGLLARQRGAVGGPQPNPLLAGAVPASISTAVLSPLPAPGPGSLPDQRLALNAPQDARGAVTDIRPAPPLPSTIRQAPPPVQVAQAAQQQQYPAGYVPPAPGNPVQPPTVGMSRREIELRTLIARNPGNPYFATAAAPELATLTQEREKRQAYADELFKAQIARDTEQAKQRLQAQMDQAKRIQEYRKGEVPQLVDNPSGSYIWDDATKSYRKPVVEGRTSSDKPPEVKMSGEQSTAQFFHNWAATAEEQLKGKEKILAEGIASELAGKVPFIGNKLMQDEYRQARGAAQRFVEAILRKTSGAAVQPSELANYQANYLPRLGDDDRSIADKQMARSGFITSLYGAAGPGREVSDWQKEQRDKQRAYDETPLGQEMKGTEKIPGKRYRSAKQPGVYRVFTPGVGWEQGYD